MLTAEIVAIGEELLSGDRDIVDTNSVEIAKMLRAIGVKVLYKTIVGDHEERIVETILNALNRVNVVITTGGLGPTVDDMTRQAIAQAVHQPLTLRPELLEELTVKFQRFGSRMSDNNKVQAMLPAKAKPIDNPVGTAPGFIVEYAGRVMYSVPGVPREMRYMMEHTVIPSLKELAGDQGIIKTRVLRTAGIGESLLDEQIGDLEKGINPAVGLAAHTGQVDIRIYATAPTEGEVDALIQGMEQEIRRRVGRYIFGVDKEPLEAAFIQAIAQFHDLIVIYEQDAEQVFHQVFDSQSSNAQALAEQVRFLPDQAMNIPPDEAELRELAQHMARQLREQQHAGMAIVLISDEVQNAVIAIDTAEASRSRTYAYGGAKVGSATVGFPVEWASRWGMSMAWSLLQRSAAQ